MANMNQLGNINDKTKETEKLRSCQIQCENCEKCYKWQTIRNIGIRYKVPNTLGISKIKKLTNHQ